MTDFNQIALFIEVIEAGSLSEAARRLNLSKSNLSRSLVKLESDMSLQLVVRNTRHFKPTEAGLDFYRRCKASFDTIKIVAQDVQDNRDQLRGKLTITAAVDFAHTILPPVAAKFTETYPNVELEIRGEDRMVDLVKEGVDLALRFGKLSDSSLRALKISDTTLILVASPAYLANVNKPKSLDQLAEYKMVSFSRRFDEQVVLKRRNGKKMKAKVKPYLRANNPLIAKALVIAGRGIALLPDMICADELKSGQLIRVLPEFSSEDSPVHFVWPAHVAESAKVRAFIEFSRDLFRNLISSQGIKRD